MDLSPGSEGARLTRLATTLISNLYPFGHDISPDQHEEALGHNRCIETARALCDTLKGLGLPAKLMPVDIGVFNPPAYQLSEQLIPIDQWPPEAWSVGINKDLPTPGPGWNGHMLVRVAREWLCDPNAGQFRREGKIHMPPSWSVAYPKEQWEVDRDGWAVVGIITNETRTPEHPHFPILRIKSRPDNTEWRQGTAANVDVSPLVENVTRIIESIRSGKDKVAFRVNTIRGDEVDLDLRPVIARFREDAND